MSFPPCPASLKQIQHLLKLAQEHDERDLILAYWTRVYALQIGLKLNSKSPEETALLLAIMDWLEGIKKEHADNEAITNEVAAQAHIENYALKLFLYADKQDREANFGKNVVKAFYSAGVIYDVLQTFGELTEEAAHNGKYAKWKAAYIHNCLKNGEVPVPGPMQEENHDDNTAADDENVNEEDDDILAPPPQPPSTNQTPDSENLPPSNTQYNIVPPTAEEILQNPSKLPSPPVEEESPGGFVAYEQPAQPHPAYTLPQPVAGVQITPDQMITAQKYCKYASSALNYDDVKTAVLNLQKALTLLTTGQDS